MIAAGRSARMFALIAVTLVAAQDAPAPRRSAMLVELKEEADSGKFAIEVRGIDAANLAALRKADWDMARWAELLSVSLMTESGKSLPIAGRYLINGDLVRFEPRFPFEPVLGHRARLDPSRLPLPRSESVPPAEFTIAPSPPPEPARVVRVEPSADCLPENLLKFYLHFSAPMGRGEAYRHVSLIDENGRKLVSPFLELGEELWDSSGTRITLLLDPGRIKRGLRPREEEGPILEAGKSYTLVVDRRWPDAIGHPLSEELKKRFRAGPADESQPDPKSWTLAAPDASTRHPISIRFPEPLDRAMLDRALVVLDSAGKKVRGRVQVENLSTQWVFVPEAAWKPGAYAIEVDPELEDLAGNSIARPFEVDVVRPNRPQDRTDPVRIPIIIREARRP